MFEIAQIEMNGEARGSELRCLSMPNVCIRLVDATTRAGISGLTVCLGNTRANLVDDYLFANSGAPRNEPPFDLGGKTYAVYAKSETNGDGWACFSSLGLERPRKGDILALDGYALLVKAPHYRPLEPQSDEDVAMPEDGPAAEFGVSPNENTVILCTLRSEDPYLPPDFASTVDTMVLEKMQKVRILVEQGANLGNQAAVLSLLANLRRVRYAGAIEVLTSPNPLQYRDQRKLIFALAPSQEQTLEAAVNATFEKLKSVLGAPKKATLTLMRDSFWRAELVCSLDVSQREFDENDARALQTLGVAYELKVDPAPDLDETSLRGATPMPEGAQSARLVVDLEILSISEPSICKKLLKLDPNYKSNEAYRNVSWIEEDAFQSDATGDRTTVGMLAAYDYSASQMEECRTTKLKTSSVLGFQPLLWHQESRTVGVAGRPQPPLCLPQAAAYFIERSAPVNVPALIASAGVTEGRDIIRSALAKSKAEQITLMTVYGIHQAHDSSTKTLLNNLSRGALAAVARGGISSKVVLFVSCKVDLAGMLDVPNARLVSVGAIDAQRQLDDLADDRLLVLHSEPSVPAPVFQLLIQQSHLPVVLEGANTSNLVQMLGKPYISVSPKYTPYVAVPDDARSGHAKLLEITRHLNGDLAHSDAALDTVAAYFHSAATHGDAFDGYFAKLRAYVRTDARDQTKLGLYRLAKALYPDPPPRIPARCSCAGGQNV